MIGMLDIQATEITAPEDVQQQETDAWDPAQMWAEFRAELEIVGEQVKEVYRNLRRVLELEARTVGAAGQAGKAARAAAVRPGAGGDRAARRGAVLKMRTAF